MAGYMVHYSFSVHVEDADDWEDALQQAGELLDGMTKSEIENQLGMGDDPNVEKIKEVEN